MISRMRSRSLRWTSRGSQTIMTPSTRSTSATASAYDSTGGARTMTTAPGRSASATIRADGRGGQGAWHVVRGGPRHQGERAGAGHVHVGAAARRPGAVALFGGPARRPDLVGGRPQVTGQRRGAQIGLHEQDVAAHLGEGGRQVDRRGGRGGVVPARGGDQEPAPLRERRVVGEPEGYRAVLLGEPRTAAADREKGARRGAFPGQGAEQRRPEGADEFPGERTAGVEDETYPGQQQSEGETDDRAEPEEQRQPCAGGSVGATGFLLR